MIWHFKNICKFELIDSDFSEQRKRFKNLPKCIINSQSPRKHTLFYPIDHDLSSKNFVQIIWGVFCWHHRRTDVLELQSPANRKCGIDNHRAMRLSEDQMQERLWTITGCLLTLALSCKFTCLSPLLKDEALQKAPLYSLSLNFYSSITIASMQPRIAHCHYLLNYKSRTESVIFWPCAINPMCTPQIDSGYGKRFSDF